MTEVNSHSSKTQVSRDVHREFENHVIKSCMKCVKNPTYFTTGIAEECAEFLDAVKLTKFDQKVNVQHDRDAYRLVISEAGDLLWYLYALSLSLPGGKFSTLTANVSEKDQIPNPVSCFYDENEKFFSRIQTHGNSICCSDVEELRDLKDQLCSAMGKLCGSVKKFSRGDKVWDTFQKRIQQDIDILLWTLVQIFLLLPKCLNAPEITLQTAMRYNIEKINSRMSNGVIRGDGENR